MARDDTSQDAETFLQTIQLNIGLPGAGSAACILPFTHNILIVHRMDIACNTHNTMAYVLQALDSIG